MKLRNVSNPAYLFENRKKILPKLVAGCKRPFFFFRRLLLAQGVVITKNDKRIVALKDKHGGQRCFVLGNGPSLRTQDLDRLKEEITFASNKIYLAFEDTDWRPTYYSVIDVLVAENNRFEIDGLNLTKVFEPNIMPFFKKESAIWLNSLMAPQVNGEPEPRFSLDALDGVYGGCTVIYLQLQLAFYLGIREIYLIGVDFSFDVPEPTGESCSSGEILKHGGEVNHFHPDYRKPGETWTMPLLDKQRAAFVEAKSTLESQGCSIFNASRKTKLDVFQVADFDSLTRI
jgi:hypothetical protein